MVYTMVKHKNADSPKIQKEVNDRTDTYTINRRAHSKRKLQTHIGHTTVRDKSQNNTDLTIR